VRIPSVLEWDGLCKEGVLGQLAYKVGQSAGDGVQSLRSVERESRLKSFEELSYLFVRGINDFVEFDPEIIEMIGSVVIQLLVGLGAPKIRRSFVRQFQLA
jgi:hypothetical protein